MTSMATIAYHGKRCLIDRLAARADEPDRVESGVQVAYSWPGRDAKPECIYGGGVQWRQPGGDDMHDGRTRLRKDTALVTLHIKVRRSLVEGDGGVRSSDERIEALAGAVAELCMEEPRMAGPRTEIRPTSGQGVYADDDDGYSSTVSIQVEIEAYIS